MSVKKIKSLMKKHWITIWLFAMCILMTAVIAFASYGESDTMLKRVVAPSADSGGLFSSNYLGLGEATDNQKPVYRPSNADNNYNYVLSLRNYNQTDPGTVYEGTIKYKLTATLVHSDSSATPYDYSKEADKVVIDAMKKKQSITVKLDDQHIITFGWDDESETVFDLTQTISDLTLSDTSSALGSDNWVVNYNGIPLDSDFCIMFEADPLDNNSDLYVLNGVISLASNPEVRTDGWTCKLSDDLSTYGYDAYDAFNYMITGTGNKILKFSYDASKVKVNPSFCSFTAEATESDHSTKAGWKTIKIEAKPDAEDDDEDKTTAMRYDIQVYKLDAADGTWDASTLKPPTAAYIEFTEENYPSSAGSNEGNGE